MERYRELIEASYRSLEENLADYVRKYASALPGSVAFIETHTGTELTWENFEKSVNFFAAILRGHGLKKGDIVATSLPLSKEHVFLIYACYRTGLIAAPLDLRLKKGELLYSFEKMKPRAYFFLGRTAQADFTDTMSELMKASPSVEHWVQFQQDDEGILDGALHFRRFLSGAGPVPESAVDDARMKCTRRDPCLIIFTTGSTGMPKAALLCHENILIQNIGISVCFDLKVSDRMLVNLPASHVGCITEQLASIIYAGGTAVILPVFDAQKSLEAIESHRVTFMGQIPALFNLQWKLSNYGDYDLSSLKYAVYGGQAASLDFLDRMAVMAPFIGTGLGLTELGGFCTYTDHGATPSRIFEGLGYASPLCPLSIREPMRPDGMAGDEKLPGETGEICFSGPQVFPGYLNDEKSTAETVSRDGFCYTGDVGSYDDRGLHLKGRSKLIIKPKGFQVFPGYIEDHIMKKLEGKAASAAVIGFEHALYSEAVIAFVEPLPGCEFTAREVSKACRDIASYARPAHIEVINPGEMPMNRVGKTDYMALRDKAAPIVAHLRSQGKWDRRR
ncbi:MAG: class I adenylate-forming enzyme family protein [Candidatus Eremiobacteraeota bacterium]|nr:class I adenylate-forming enzyme family protein [Candidatus Eremiobacteraeota bacterium]